MAKPILLRLLILAAASIPFQSLAQTAPLPKTPKSPTSSLWLFAGFKANSEDGVYYALSSDGYHWTLANGGKPVVIRPNRTS